jgi:hypothetical protein
MAVVHPEYVGGDEATKRVLVGLVLDLRVKAEDEKVEIPPVRGFESLAKDAREPCPAQSRAWWQSRQSRKQDVGKCRNRTKIRSSRVRRLISAETVTGVRTPRTISTFSCDIARAVSR